MNVRAAAGAGVHGAPWWLAALVGLCAVLASAATYQYGPVWGAVFAVGPAGLGGLCIVAPTAWRRCRALGARVDGLIALLPLLLAGLCLEHMLPEISQRSAKELTASPINIVNLGRTFTVALAGLACLAVGLRHVRALSQGLKGPVGLMGLFAAMAVLSVTYASAPLVSAGKSLEIAVDVALAILMASLLSAEQLVNAWNVVWLYLGALVTGVWISTAFSPSAAFDSSSAAVLVLHGVRPNIAPNTLGQFSAMLVVVASCRLLAVRARTLPDRLLWAGVIGLGLVTMAFAQARTTIAALPVALALCFYLHRRWRLLAFSLAAVALALASGLGTLVLDFLRRKQDLDQLVSLSGRLGYWGEAWQFFRESMLVGHGYYTATRLDLNARYIYTGLDLSTTDNTYLAVLLDVGLAGALPLLAAIVGVVWLGWRALRSASLDPRLQACTREMLSVLVIVFVRSTTGSTFERHSENMLLMLITMAFFQRISQRARPAAPVPARGLRL